MAALPVVYSWLLRSTVERCCQCCEGRTSDLAPRLRPATADCDSVCAAVKVGRFTIPSPAERPARVAIDVIWVKERIVYARAATATAALARGTHLPRSKAVSPSRAEVQLSIKGSMLSVRMQALIPEESLPTAELRMCLHPHVFQLADEQCCLCTLWLSSSPSAGEASPGEAAQEAITCKAVR